MSALIRTRHMIGIHLFIIFTRSLGVPYFLPKKLLIAQDANVLCGLLWRSQGLLYFSNVVMHNGYVTRLRVREPNEESPDILVSIFCSSSIKATIIYKSDLITNILVHHKQQHSQLDFYHDNQ